MMGYEHNDLKRVSQYAHRLGWALDTVSELLPSFTSPRCWAVITRTCMRMWSGDLHKQLPWEGSPPNKSDDSGSVIDDGDYDEVQELLERRTDNGGQVEYLVWWKASSAEAATWEPESNLKCPELLHLFQAKQPPRPAPPLEAAPAPRAESRPKAAPAGAVPAAAVRTVPPDNDTTRQCTRDPPLTRVQSLLKKPTQKPISERFCALTVSLNDTGWVYTVPQQPTAAAGCTISSPSITRILDEFVKIANDPSSQIPWCNMFQDTLPSGEVIRDQRRQQTSMGPVAAKATSQDSMRQAMDSVKALATHLAKDFEGFTSESDIYFDMWSFIKSVPSGNWDDVMDRLQRFHKDCHAVMFREFGEVHSLFVCMCHPRNLLVTCLRTGKPMLLRMQPYSVTLLHGRWAHAGVGLPFCSPDDTPHYVLFSYVFMQARNNSSTRFVNYSLLSQHDKMESVSFLLTEDLVDADRSSLGWTPAGEVHK